MLCKKVCNCRISRRRYSCLSLRLAWKGVDTVVVCAGVSALRPLLEVAGVNSFGEQATVDGVRHAMEVSNAALRGNYTGPLVSAVTFVCYLLPYQSNSSLKLGQDTAAGIYVVFTCSATCFKPGRSLSSAHPLTIRLDKSGLAGSLPGSSHRTPTRPVLQRRAVHSRRRLPCFCGGRRARARR